MNKKNYEKTDEATLPHGGYGPADATLFSSVRVGIHSFFLLHTGNVSKPRESE